MFKAKLIENPRYYKLVRLQSILLIFMFLTYCWFLAIMQLTVWGMVAAFLAFIVVVCLLLQNKYAIGLLTGQKMLEIDGDHILVMDSEEKKISEWDIRTADSIVTNKEYNLPNDSFPEVLNSWKGNPTRNFIEFRQGDQKTHLEFHLDSDYMRTQIKKIVDHWVASDFHIERK